jgi:dTDP-4-amino-4,6-dideoxygalactose transaminase
VSEPAARLREDLSRRLDGRPVSLHASGREALRVGLRACAEHSDRNEVVLPAYVCFSVPAAVVAAGLRVRLVDVDDRGRIDSAALSGVPLERAVALVVGNLFGIPEAVAPLVASCSASGVALVDDAAQALGSHSHEGPVGARGELGVLSFGRGKPLSALGGGALVWPLDSRPEIVAEPAPRALRRGSALLRAAAWNAALQPMSFRLLAAIPALGIGETHFDPGFTRGGIDGGAACLAAAQLPGLAEQARARVERALRLAEQLQRSTRFQPLLAQAGAFAVYPRLGVLAPAASARNRALAALRDEGATAFYPASLADLPALAPHLVEPADCPGARLFAARLLTLPTHAGLAGRRLAHVLRTLRDLS